jgi:hypothetical protein
VKKLETISLVFLLLVVLGSTFSHVSALTPYVWEEGDYFVYEIVANKQTFEYRFEVVEKTDDVTKIRVTIRESGNTIYENTFRIRKGDKAGEYDPTAITEEAADKGEVKVVDFTVNDETKKIRVREWVKDGTTVWISEDAGILLKTEGKDFTMTLIQTNINIPEATAATGTGGDGGIPGFPIESIIVGVTLGVALIIASRRQRAQIKHI